MTASPARQEPLVSAPTLIHADAEQGLQLIASPAPGEGFLQCLETARFGSGDLRYRRLGTAAQIAALPAPVCIELRSDQATVGTYLLARSDLLIEGHKLPAVYRSLLTLAPSHRDRGLGRHIVKHTLDWLQQQALANWGCIEAGNRRAQRLLVAHGAADAGGLEANLLYRQWPRRQCTIQNPDEAAVIAALDANYSDCALRSTHDSRLPYQAVVDGGRIVAGARVRDCAIDLRAPNGGWARHYAKLVRHFAPIRRRFDPSRFRYLQLLDVVVDEQAGCWNAFVESLLAEHQAHMAMVLLDPRSRTFQHLSRAGAFGAFSRRSRQRIRLLLNPGSGDPPAPPGTGPIQLSPPLS